MRLTAVLAIACLVALAFAGCSGKDKDGGATSSSSSSSRSSTSATSSSTSHSATSTSTSSSSTSTGPTNHAPTGAISAVLNGTAATFNLTGTDADGDSLVWDLDFGDGNATNGTALPTVATHTYVNVTGNVTVIFAMTDGQAPVSYNVTLNLTGGAKGQITFAGTTTGIDPTAGGLPPAGPVPAQGCLFSDPEDPSPGGRQHAIDAPIDGWAWTVSEPYAAWFSNDAGPLGGGGTSGTVPVGATAVAICTDDPTVAPAGSYAFTATAP
jgi:hypothetical protein